MNIDTIDKIIGMAGGVIAILRGLKELFKVDTTTSATTTPQKPINIITKLVVAIGIVVLLYGGVLFVRANQKINSVSEACLDNGRDRNSYADIQYCNQYASSQFEKYIKPSLITIGTSFILIATATFIRNYSTASISLLAFEIIWFVLGIWLIKSNL